MYEFAISHYIDKLSMNFLTNHRTGFCERENSNDLKIGNSEDMCPT